MKNTLFLKEPVNPELPELKPRWQVSKSLKNRVKWGLLSLLAIAIVFGIIQGVSAMTAVMEKWSLESDLEDVEYQIAYNEGVASEKWKLKEDIPFEIDALEEKLESIDKELESLESENVKLDNQRKRICRELGECTKEVIEEPLHSAPPVEADNELSRLNTIICKKSPSSPLCNNTEMQKSLKSISDSRGVPFWLMVGITYAESHIGVNYASGCNSSYNNWGGVKARKLDDGKVIDDKPIPDSRGCWIYPFGSVEDYWASKANSLKQGYLDQGCNTSDPAKCISRCYVGGCATGINEKWTGRVNIFKP